MKYKIIIVICILFLLVGCGQLEDKSFRKMCNDNLKDLSCDQLLDCYDFCDDLWVITHINTCREMYKARIWKCYGANNE